MLYHYTTIPAMMSILRDAVTLGQMCFWATRYDCFTDTEEFKHGVETIRRLLPEVEKDLPVDRQIAPLFEWNEIKNNKNLPYPYVVSFCSRLDNEYMWREYAKEDGVVLAIDDKETVEVHDTPVLRLVSCIYADGSTDDKLTEMLRQEYEDVAYRILGGPEKEFAFALLKDFPQEFVKLIAAGLLLVTAPRIKNAKDYWMEEETRAIIPLPIPSYNALIEGYDETISTLDFEPMDLRALVANECTRQKEDGSIVFYRKMHLPIHLLNGVYVKKEATMEAVRRFFAEFGLNIQVKRLNKL